MIDKEAVKARAQGRELEMLVELAGIPADLLDGKHHPCPKCEGVDRFRLVYQDTGGVMCNRCFREGNRDWLAAVQWMDESTFPDAVQKAAAYLGVTDEPAPKVDIITAVCQAKRMPREAFEQFGATPAKRGKLEVARVPAYGADGEQCSHFDLPRDSKEKGWFAKGKGAGMFFPGRKPQPGETWHLAEGLKDAAALVGLDLLAAGMPGSSMKADFAKLFTGCHIVLVPDLDEPSWQGAQQTGGRLRQIASSVRIARLPGGIRASRGDDVRDVLQRTDGESVVRDAIGAAVPWQPEVAADDGGLATVFLDHQEDKVAADVLRHIHKGTSDRERIYQRGGVLVHITESENLTCDIHAPDTMLRIRQLPSALVRERISATVRLVERPRDAEAEPKRQRPARWLVEAIYQRGEYPRNIPQLAGVVRCPTLRPDGSVLQKAGYDRKTGLLYVPDGDYPEVPTKPSKDDAARAAAELLDVVCDFPFTDDSHNSAWLALLLTMVGRAAIAGPCPLFAFDANTRGSGKSLATDAAAIIALGDILPRKNAPPDDKEMCKTITSIALEALPVVMLDNAAGMIGCASLDAALTGTTWHDRILGTNTTTGTLPLNTIWCTTGNNLAFRADTARRVVYCRLESPEENPEDRTGFKHPNLIGWLRGERHRLAVAAVTVLRAFVAAGRPKQGLQPWGSYEAWSDLIRGAVVHAGLPDPVTTRQVVRDADRSAETLRLLIVGLEEIGEPATAADIGRILSRDVGDHDPYPSLRAAISELCSKLDARSIGNRLRSFKGRVCGGMTIDSVKIGKQGLGHWTTKPSGVCTASTGCKTTPYASEKSTTSVCENEYRDGTEIHAVHPLHPASDDDRELIA